MNQRRGQSPGGRTEYVNCWTAVCAALTLLSAVLFGVFALKRASRLQKTLRKGTRCFGDSSRHSVSGILHLSTSTVSDTTALSSSWCIRKLVSGVLCGSVLSSCLLY